jgi:phage tail sheath protein FI
MALRYQYNEGDRDILSQAQVNGIRNYSGVFPIWGEYTLQLATSSLSSVPVVRLVMRIVTSLADMANFYVFEPNNTFCRLRLSNACKNYLDPIYKAGGLYDYDVVCDGRNNTSNTIDLRELNVDVYLKPVLCALYLKVQAIVTSTSASFSVTESLMYNANG